VPWTWLFLPTPAVLAQVKHRCLLLFNRRVTPFFPLEAKTLHGSPLFLCSRAFLPDEPCHFFSLEYSTSFSLVWWICTVGVYVLAQLFAAWPIACFPWQLQFYCVSLAELAALISSQHRRVGARRILVCLLISPPPPHLSAPFSVASFGRPRPQAPCQEWNGFDFTFVFHLFSRRLLSAASKKISLDFFLGSSCFTL